MDKNKALDYKSLDWLGAAGWMEADWNRRDWIVVDRSGILNMIVSFG